MLYQKCKKEYTSHRISEDEDQNSRDLLQITHTEKKKKVRLKLNCFL